MSKDLRVNLATRIVIVLFFVMLLFPSSTYCKKLCSEQEIFLVLFKTLKRSTATVFKKELRFNVSTAHDVYEFIEAFPIKYDLIETWPPSNNRNPELIQVYYGNYWFVFSFGKHKEKWNNKLIQISFSLHFPYQIIPELETETYFLLQYLYGDYTKSEKFKYTDGTASKLNMFLWDISPFTITYRSLYQDNATIIVVCYNDSEYYSRYPYE
jgi:hypothetical protein